ncbi:inositol monophosphatase family protein [Patulibacter minatonensis]|uniref:inositol monophosphatase family protein n=1 Tax=Patulibacter minatonensis TaxID=298163 RepID=UPI0004B6B515|nr:inositol monophosphatase family protein [Patulibacter minatonensis]
MEPTDLEVARAAAAAAADAVVHELTHAVEVDEKSSPTDLVTSADRAGEEAAFRLLGETRPSDGVQGEEGHRRTGRRVWLIDPVDGTLNLVRGLPGWACVVGLEEDGGSKVAVVHDVTASQTFSAERGRGAFRDGERMRVREDVALDAALVSTYLHPSKRGMPGVDAVNRALLIGVGALRAGAGSGSLELAWIADGRLDGWVQPDLAAWDWAPGAHLVREAGGRAVEIRPLPDGPVWGVAGTPRVCDALVRLVEVAALG